MSTIDDIRRGLAENQKKIDELLAKPKPSEPEKRRFSFAHGDTTGAFHAETTAAAREHFEKKLADDPSIESIEVSDGAGESFTVERPKPPPPPPTTGRLLREMYMATRTGGDELFTRHRVKR